MLIRNLCETGAVATLWLICLTTLPADAASENVTRTVHGIVVATNATDTPQTIVIRVILPDGQEMIVGAAVPPGTGITRGKQPVGLSDIKAGGDVTMTYQKHSKGLTARSIHAK